MTDLPAELLTGLDVRSAAPVRGGDIARAYRLTTADGPLFLKHHPEPKPQLFQREAAGLRALRRATPPQLHVPEVLRESANGLVLQWVEPGRPGASTERDLGIGLAALHRTTHPTFGGLDTELVGYLGSAEVDLTPTTDWVEFYLDRRITPLLEKAIDLGEVPASARSLLSALEPRAAELCGPPEPPALVHGDLWAGNRLVDAKGANWLIDPASYWAHREVDLAMMQLFGGFGRDCFTAYDETYPLADGWHQRIPWYQLPPLLVHAIPFGGSYGASVLSVLRRYQ